MTNKLTENRLVALDGLRGLMCLLVVWQHFGLSNLLHNEQVPVWTKWIFWIVGNQGGLGVFFFFTLAGFLMTTLYFPVKNGVDFYLKRMGRILPLFLGMSLIMAFDKYFGLNGSGLILIGGMTLITGNFFWDRFFAWKKSNKTKLQIIGGFFGFTLLAYAYFLRQNVGVFEGANLYVKIILTTMVNATATFGFGDYIPVLGLVFWSMGAEILFYFAYPVLPVLFAPLAAKRPRDGIFLLLLLTLYLLIFWTSNKFLSFNFYHPETSIYFLLGYFWGCKYRSGNPQPLVLGKSKMKNLLFWLYGGFVLWSNAFSSVYGHPFLNNFSKVLLDLFFVSEVFAYLLQAKTSIMGRIFTSKMLLFIGTISYSLYLVHSLVIDNLGGVVMSDPLLVLLFKFVILTIVSVFFAYIVYMLSEKRYFDTYKNQIKQYSSTYRSTLIERFLSRRIWTYLLVLLVVVFINRPLASLFSLESIQSLKANVAEKNLLLSEKPFAISFTSLHEGMNYFTLWTEYAGPIQNYDQSKNFTTIAKLRVDLFDAKDDTRKVIASFWQDAFRLNKTETTKISFPLQANSKNKDYIANISLVAGSEKEEVKIKYDGTTQVGYNLNKKTTLSSPIQLWLVLQYQLGHYWQNLTFWGQLLGISCWVVIYQRLAKKD